MASLKVASVEILRDTALRCHEITVLLSSDGEEGWYIFLVTDIEWKKAVARGLTTNGSMQGPLPCLIAGTKEKSVAI